MNKVIELLVSADYYTFTTKSTYISLPEEQYDEACDIIDECIKDWQNEDDTTCDYDSVQDYIIDTLRMKEFDVTDITPTSDYVINLGGLE